MKCHSCEDPKGPYTSGVPGILARMKDRRVHPAAQPERCDVCARYPGDIAAVAELRRRDLLAMKGGGE